MKFESRLDQITQNKNKEMIANEVKGGQQAIQPGVPLEDENLGKKLQTYWDTVGNLTNPYADMTGKYSRMRERYEQQTPL